MGVHILYSAAAVFIYMVLFFLLGLKLKNNSIVDIGWGPGFIIVALVNLALAETKEVTQIILTVLITLWAVRLSTYIFMRNKGKGEDFRYARWRKDWGKYVHIRSFFQIFMLQGFFMLIIAYPVLLINTNSLKEINIVTILGILIWSTGFIFETIGDYQLFNFIRNFKKTPGEFITTGLWKYTRHPNYFGESLIWWGVFLLVFPANYGWTAFFSPLIMTFLLLKVSGVPMLEKKYKENEKYKEYTAKTNKFVPWFR